MTNRRDWWGAWRRWGGVGWKSTSSYDMTCRYISCRTWQVGGRGGDDRSRKVLTARPVTENCCHFFLIAAIFLTLKFQLRTTICISQWCFIVFRAGSIGDRMKTFQLCHGAVKSVLSLHVYFLLTLCWSSAALSGVDSCPTHCRWHLPYLWSTAQWLVIAATSPEQTLNRISTGQGFYSQYVVINAVMKPFFFVKKLNTETTGWPRERKHFTFLWVFLTQPL